MKSEKPKFEICALDVAGGTLAIAPMPGRGGHYAQDFGVLLAWIPQLVVSMTTIGEMSARMPEDLATHGIAWAHVPIVDFGAPDTETSQTWRGVEAQALAALQSGGRVLVHCRAGCGRSGMACLRLMVAAGEDGRAALKRLRAVRPCAVETGEQMDWALSLP